MKKKFLSAFCLSIAAVVALSFIGCGGKEPQPTHTVDTYTGAISTESYATVDEAAKAFVDNEISGAITSARFVSYSKQAELSNEEVDTLDIPQDEKACIAVVERGEVKYSDETTDESGVHTSADDEKSFTVFIVTYNDGAVKFYSPKLNTGDVLTKSYFDKLFAVENYENFTMSNSDERIRITYDNINKAYKVTRQYEEGFCKYTRENNRYLKLNNEYDSTFVDKFDLDINNLEISKEWFDSGIKPQTEEIFEVTDKSSEFNGVQFMRQFNSDVPIGTTPGWIGRKKPDSENNNAFLPLDSSDHIRLWLLQTADHTYFIKTDTGFKLNTEKNDAYNNSFAACLSILWKNCDYKIEADYQVEEGKLSKIDFILKADGEHYAGASSSLYEEQLAVVWTLTVRAYDYGTTVADVPEDLDMALAVSVGSIF